MASPSVTAFSNELRRASTSAAMPSGERSDESIALARAELLRGEIGNLRLTYGGEPLGMITVSVGVVCSRDGTESAEQLVRTADHAMYEAKQGGRNQVVLKAAKPLAAA